MREEKKVTVSWSRDNSPAPLTPKSGSPLKSPESSFNEKQIQLPKNEQESLQADDSKGAKRKIPAPLLKSSQKEDLPKSPSKLASEQKPPSKALLQKLAMVEAEPREKYNISKSHLDFCSNQFSL